MRIRALSAAEHSNADRPSEETIVHGRHSCRPTVAEWNDSIGSDKHDIGSGSSPKHALHRVVYSEARKRCQHEPACRL